MILDFDTLHWELTGGILRPINPPKDINYPAVDDVAFPVVFGYDDQFMGTLIAGFPPAPPTLTVEDLGGGVARFTISGSTVGTSNQVYIRSTTATAWGASPVVTIAGDGSATATIDAGPYLAKVQSHLAGAVSPANNEPVLFHLQDAASGYTRSAFGTEFMESVKPELLTAFGELVQYLRGVQGVEVVAMQGDIITTNDPQTGIDISVGDASWEISADDLDFGSGPIVPKAQDQIISSTNEVYVVVEAGVLDSEQMFWTIPVKRSDYKELP